MKMELKKILTIIFCLYAFTSQAQSSDSLINNLVAKHVSINEKKLSMPGYRVQIYFGAKRDKATEIKTGFNQAYPEIPAYLSYQQPNFKVRVGDCKTRLEATKILESIKGVYDVAFIVKDDVKLPDVK